MDLRRYAVNMRLKDFGETGQQRLLDSSLLIVGCGALGSGIAMYTAGAGVGRIGLMDFDTVDMSNLQRQVFFKESDAGKSKSELMGAAVKALNSDCKVEIITKPLTTRNGDEIVSNYDFIVDAADNPDTTYLIEKLCNAYGKGYVTAGVAGYHAQILTHLPGTINFSDIFPPGVESAGMLPCSIEGVFGPLTGIVAGIETSEALKCLSGCGRPMTDAILRINLQTNEYQLLKV
ncbi:MAG: HesA/MoeB/ThiF family protein [Clostridium sp.]|nr:HesA/MoeB/ThiF family protein [Prevotella sp.]MCM1429306.1 HesA/MoeB/ThiF family protein [Clostridium sp.]MCM1475661.1 HesA/MoeB/ThiF family protein [Muribaculaceae bacterium]